MGHCASRALIVSCTGDCAWVCGGNLHAVGDPWAPGGLLAADRSGAVVLVWFLLNVLEWVFRVVICILLLFVCV